MNRFKSWYNTSPKRSEKFVAVLLGLLFGAVFGVLLPLFFPTLQFGDPLKSILLSGILGGFLFGILGYLFPKTFCCILYPPTLIAEG